MSPVEARKLPGISERFEMLNANCDGHLSREELSREEFNTGAKL